MDMRKLGCLGWRSHTSSPNIRVTQDFFLIIFTIKNIKQFSYKRGLLKLVQHGGEGILLSFLKSEAARGKMRCQNGLRIFLWHKQRWNVITGFFWVAESISAIFKWFWSRVIAKSRVEDTKSVSKCQFHHKVKRYVFFTGGVTEPIIGILIHIKPVEATLAQ